MCRQDTPTVPTTPTSGCSSLFQQMYSWETLVKELIELSETQEMTGEQNR